MNLSTEKSRKTHFLCNEENEKWINYHVNRETGVE
jgi:hypothetical protein